MQVKLNKLISDLLRNHTGGEAYCSALDTRLQLRENLEIVQALFEDLLDSTVAVTGSFGDYVRLLKNHHQVFPVSLVHFSGGIRKGNVPRVLYSSPRLSRFVTIIDDSFYSGRTVGAIERVLNSAGYSVVDIRVVYDGSLERWELVKSLYRYYDHHPARQLLLH